MLKTHPLSWQPYKSGASLFGQIFVTTLSRACEFIRQQKKLKQENPQKSYEISHYARKSSYDEFMPRKFIYKFLSTMKLRILPSN
jgi:hypothetical protein